MRKLIGISGKIGSGKSTFAEYLSEIIWNDLWIDSMVVSIGDAVKEECAAVFGFPVKYAYTQAGKDTFISVPAQGKHMTIRKILQWWGTDIMRTLVDEDYWIKVLDQRLGDGVVIIDDIRFPNEADYIKSKGGYLIRLDTTYTETSEKLRYHLSETVLDDYQGFDLRLSPEYGTLGKVAHELDLSVILGLES